MAPSRDWLAPNRDLLFDISALVYGAVKARHERLSKPTDDLHENTWAKKMYPLLQAPVLVFIRHVKGPRRG